MFYQLFTNIQESAVPGARLMSYITFRSGAAFVLALLLAVFVGKYIINRLKRMQISEVEETRFNTSDQGKKKPTPTMGGIIIILSILLPCLLIGNLDNVYMQLMLLSTLWLGIIGFIDDFKKLKKHNKDGLKGKYKLIGQFGLATIVAVTMYLNPNMVIVENTEVINEDTQRVEEVIYKDEVVKSPQTTIPFVKNNNFNYSSVTSWMGDHAETGGWIFFFFITVLFVLGTSNGANLNDGMDGMCAGLSAIAGVALAVMAYLGGNIIYSAYLNIMYVPGSEELVVYMAAFIGALIGFLWYNAAPAEVYMGDTGSLTLGGIIAVFAILIHKELLLPILCLLFYLEDISVMIQVPYFRRTGRRIFRITPIHHHFEKPGDGSYPAKIQWPHESIARTKIVTRFWIVGIILAAITFVTLKIR